MFYMRCVSCLGKPCVTCDYEQDREIKERHLLSSSSRFFARAIALPPKKSTDLYAHLLMSCFDAPLATSFGLFCGICVRPSVRGRVSVSAAVAATASGAPQKAKSTCDAGPMVEMAARVRIFCLCPPVAI